MSVTSRQQHEQEHWECDYCDDEHPPHEFFNGAMCSEQCERRDRAESLLNTIKYDHRLCFSCGKQLKTIEKPPQGTTVVIGPCRHNAAPETATDVLVGYEYATKHATSGEISLDVVDDPDTDGRPLSDRVGHGMTCSCGATDHTDGDGTIRNRHPFESAHAMFTTVELLRREGETDERLAYYRLMDTLCATIPTEGRPESIDLEAALADAIIL